ncbi:hypothetical protein THAR02_06748 [Trichoderma harzianum]|uniref:Aminoglycoside phosphotransferase domain-containing protein n=1 Tax=Trichoderma harzianum TaxID=5544 RepID=A0A0F9X9G0_TRIHA|nr:hypothetical protein THAR02_06748 [Trichoderma harzianum]
MTPARNSNVQLSSVLVDWNDEEKGAYRFLVDGKDTKYVTVEPGVLPKDSRTFGPILIPLLPPFPPGEWNEGYVSKDPLSIKHGDINKYNFLIREGKAMLVDFEASQRCNEKQELEAEYEQFEASLSDTSTRGVP